MNTESVHPNSEAVGYLVVRVSAADGAVPISDATVTVSDNTGNEILYRKTDRSGLTARMTLPTMPISQSLSPGKIAFINYRIRTAKDGFYSVQNTEVPIYPGITSVQGVAMIPLALSDNGSSAISPPTEDIYFDEKREGI